MSLAKPRPTGGRTSVEINMRNGRLDTISFKILDENDRGFASWNAKPTVILSGPITAEASSGIGFHKVILIDGEVATEYEVIGPNSWSKVTRPYKE